MGQGFIDLYFYHEFSILVVCVGLGALLMLPRSVIGYWHLRQCAHGKGFMAYEMEQRPVTLFLTVYRENPEVFEVALKRYRASLDKWSTVSAIVCVIDAADLFPEETKLLGDIAERYGAYVFCTNARAKRENLRNAMRWARVAGVLHTFTLFGDSDTIATTADDDIVGELLRPFGDPTIGGVTTAQRLTMVDSTLQVLLDWLEDARIGSGMSAGGAFHQVVCMPGRLYAVRTVLVERWMDRLVEEYWTVPRYQLRWPFVSLERVQAHAGDDRRITIRVQEKGFGVVMNPRATVVTTMPRSLWRVSVVMLRWATSSQWLTVVATYQYSWYRRLLMVMYLAWGDIAITLIANFIQFRFIYSLFEWAMGWGEAQPLLSLATWLLVTLTGLVLGFGLRQVWHLAHHPWHVLLLPIFIVFVSYLQIIRLIPWVNPRRISVWGSRVGSGLRVAPLFFTPFQTWLTDHETVGTLTAEKKGDQDG